MLVCAYLLFGMWAVASRRHPGAAVCVPVAIMLVMIANNVGAYQYNDSVYRIEDDEVTEMRLLADFVDGPDRGEQVLFVLMTQARPSTTIPTSTSTTDVSIASTSSRGSCARLGAGAIAQKALLPKATRRWGTTSSAQMAGPAMMRRGLAIS